MFPVIIRTQLPHRIPGKNPFHFDWIQESNPTG
jgi:hypothetical protein